MNNIYISIDFSLISPGISLLQNNNFKWVSVFNEDSENHHKILSKKNGAFNVLNESDSVTIKLRDKAIKEGSATYSETERVKITTSISNISAIIQEIKEQLKSFKPGDIYVAVEGVSFGSPGNTLIDICMATGILRQAIINDLLNGDDSKFYVFSPGTIKKYALKGTAKKNELYEELISKQELQHLEFVKLLDLYKDDWITPGGTVKKPLDDLVDATWIALLLRDVIENGLEAEVAKPLKKKSKKKKTKKA